MNNNKSKIYLCINIKIILKFYLKNAYKKSLENQ